MVRSEIIKRWGMCGPYSSFPQGGEEAELGAALRAPTPWVLASLYEGPESPHVVSTQGWGWELGGCGRHRMWCQRRWAGLKCGSRVGCFITSLEISSKLAIGFLCLGATPLVTTLVQLLGHWYVILAAWLTPCLSFPSVKWGRVDDPPLV